MTNANDAPAYTRSHWAKSDRQDHRRIHLLEYHLADVGACFEELLAQPTIRQRLAHSGGLDTLDDATAARLALFAALHDIGKVNTGFQTQIWLAAKVVEHLVHLIATVSPGAKLGSTAPYGYADLMVVEAGTRQPRSLANAYRDPAKAQVAAATERLTSYLGKLDAAYAARDVRRVMSVEGCDIPSAERLSLDDLASWAAAAIGSGTAE